MMRRLGVGPLLLLALVLTACGSTAQQSRSAPGADGLTGPGAMSVDPLTGQEVDPGSHGEEGAIRAGAPGPGAAAAATGPGLDQGAVTWPSSTGATGSRKDQLPSPMARAAAADRPGPGVGDKTVRIGFQYVDAGPGTAAVLGQDVSLGDPTQQAEAVRDWINSNGGMGGRTLDLVSYGAPYASYINNPQAEYNKICTYYTEDHKVLGVAAYIPAESLVRCLAKRDVISVGTGYPLDRQLYSELAQHFYSPATMSQDRGAEVGVEGLHGVGFYKGAKIGVLRFDEPMYARAERSLGRALAGKGLQIEETFLIDNSNASQASSDVAAAVLRFREKGITHVTVLDNNGGICLTFMQAAENQGYRPFYALTTNNGPGALAALAPSEQLVKAKAVSWWWGDVSDEKQQTPPAIPASRDLCLEIMREAGVDLSAGAAKASAVVTCDQLFMFKALMDRAAAPNSASLSAVADRLGTAHQSPVTYRTTLGPGRRDGATLTRLIRFDGDCRCWLYERPGPSAS